jgi:hypothetical protein
MNKVWDKFGRMFAESGTFPGFKEIYNSPEVQGSDQPRTVTAQTLQGGNGTSGGNRSLNPRQSNGDGAQPAKRGAREWIDDADEAITKLEDYPSFIPLVRRSDIDTLRGLIPRIRRIVAPKRTPYR